MSTFQSIKLFLIGYSGLAKDALHIYVGLFAFFVILMLRGGRVGEAKPLIIVLFIALAGEAWDLRDSATLKSPIHLWDNWHDIWNTIFWPSFITVMARTTAIFKN